MWKNFEFCKLIWNTASSSFPPTALFGLRKHIAKRVSFTERTLRLSLHYTDVTPSIVLCNSIGM